MNGESMLFRKPVMNFIDLTRCGGCLEVNPLGSDNWLIYECRKCSWKKIVLMSLLFQSYEIPDAVKHLYRVMIQLVESIQ